MLTWYHRVWDLATKVGYGVPRKNDCGHMSEIKAFPQISEEVGCDLARRGIGSTKFHQPKIHCMMKVKTKNLETMKQFKYLDAIISQNRSKPEVKVRVCIDNSCDGMVEANLEGQKAQPQI